ncbi:MAG: hypothetical protein NVS4B12_19430 [Ktedonobacteraceae bacterium]
MGSPESRPRPTPEQPPPLMIEVETQRAMLDMLLNDLPRHILAMMNHRYSPEDIENVAKVRQMATTIAQNLGEEVQPGNALRAGLTDLIPANLLREAAEVGDSTARFLLDEKRQLPQLSPIEPTS